VVFLVKSKNNMLMETGDAISETHNHSLSNFELLFAHVFDSLLCFSVSLGYDINRQRLLMTN